MESAVSQPPASAPAASGQKKVHSACQRCRTQKLKCDVYRPCMLCVRAGATCSAAVRPTTWKLYRSGQNQKPKRNSEGAGSSPAAKRPRCASPVECITSASTIPSKKKDNTPGERLPSPHENNSSWISNSAAMKFMEEAFHQHQTNSPDGEETSAFSASNWTQRDKVGTVVPDDESTSDRFEARKNPYVPERLIRHDVTSRLQMNSPTETELLSLLPPLEVATILVNNYFERIHWFLLVFHQTEFRDLFRQLYQDVRQHPRQHSVGFGILCVFSAVCTVSLGYIDAPQRTILSECGVQAEVLQHQLLSTLRLRLLEIVSRGSIEAVQVCVLLGSFHLYHGEPELAWPICGCGLRIAQALNLHRRHSHRASRTPDLDDPSERAEETRKRCWWAVYEIETFCSMLYGFPLSITDEDCDVELLNPYPLRSEDASWDPAVWQKSGQATLLSYKHAMAQLSMIVKSVLKDLYGIRPNVVPKNGNSSTTDRNRLQKLITTANSLDKKLREWYVRLPSQLRTDATTHANHGSREHSVSRDTAASTENAFRDHLFELQALSLKIAFENTRILIHRPLLSYRMVIAPTTSSSKGLSSSTPIASDTCQSSVEISRDAALQISKLGSLPIFQVVADTYANSFVSLHLLTAAVALSILATLTPLSQDSHDCKMGIRRLMEMQSRLKARSIIAQQGLGILRKLMSLVLSKEMAEMLERPNTDETTVEEAGTIPAVQGTQVQENSRQSQPLQDPYQFTQYDGPSADQMPMDAMLMPTSDPGTVPILAFGFYEDPTITQALLDFEQVVNYTPSGATGESMPLVNTEYSTGSCFSVQDQSWIWGSNHYI